MTACRTIAEVEAQADRDSEGELPMSQETADKVAAILLAAKSARQVRI